MPYSSVSHIGSYHVSDDRITLDCALLRGRRETLAGQQGDAVDVDRTVPISLRFYNPATFRFALDANPETGEAERLIDRDEDAIERSVNLEVTEEEDILTINTEKLEILLGHEKWSFLVRDGDTGDTLFEEQREDRDAKDHRRVDPLGFPVSGSRIVQFSTNSEKSSSKTTISSPVPTSVMV